MTVVGLLGAGRMGETLARLLAGAGHDVRLANSRGPATLAGLVADIGPGAAALAARDIADGAEVVILATRWEQLPDAVGAVPSWDGVIVVDTTNPRFGPGPDEVYDTGALTSSEVVAGLVPGARLVKAASHLSAELLGQDPILSGGRRVIFVSGDNAPAKQAIIDLFNAAGFYPIDLGDLVSGGRMQQFGGPLAGRNLLQGAT